MARIRRIVIPNIPHHITQRGVRSRNIFFKHEDYQYYKELLYFQERFYSTPLDDIHFLYAIRYVEQNPVKAYMVKYPWDYKYSSARYRMNKELEDKLLSNYEPIDKIVNYKEFLQENTQTKLIQEKTKTGKPCGDTDFYDKIKLLTGIDYKNKKPGPKVENDFKNN